MPKNKKRLGQNHLNEKQSRMNVSSNGSVFVYMKAHLW